MSYQHDECDCGRISGSMFRWPEEGNVDSLLFRAEAARGSKNYDEALKYYNKAKMLLGQANRYSCCGYKVDNSIKGLMSEIDASTSTSKAAEGVLGCTGFFFAFVVVAGVIAFFVRRGANPRSTVYAFANQAWPVIIAIAVICIIIFALGFLYAFIKDRTGK